MNNAAVKEYIARTLPNKLTLAETLDKIRQIYKSISFESKMVADGYDGLFDAKERMLRRDSIEYMMGDLVYYQTCIDYGNYVEVNPYAG